MKSAKDSIYEESWTKRYVIVELDPALGEQRHNAMRKPDRSRERGHPALLERSRKSRENLPTFSKVVGRPWAIDFAARKGECGA